MSTLIDPFRLPFMQDALLELVLLAPIAGILGAQIVLRRLAFFTHALGTAAFPGLVLAGPLGVPTGLMALGVGGLFAASLTALTRVARVGRDVATGLLLVLALSIGIVLASDVYESGAEVDRLLFGSLLAIGSEEIRATSLALGLICVAAWTTRRTWLASGFDPANAPGLGLPARRAEIALVLAIAVAVIASLDAVGALLVAAILVIPAATVRLYARSVPALEIGTSLLALVQGVAGLWVAYRLDVPPGAAIATLGGLTFFAAAAARVVASRGLVQPSVSAG